MCSPWNRRGTFQLKAFALLLSLPCKLFPGSHLAHSPPSSLCLSLIFSMRLTLTVLFNTVPCPLPAHWVPSQHSWSCSAGSTVFLPCSTFNLVTHHIIYLFNMFPPSPSLPAPQPFPTTSSREQATKAGVFVSADEPAQAPAWVTESLFLRTCFPPCFVGLWVRFSSLKTV